MRRQRYRCEETTEIACECLMHAKECYAAFRNHVLLIRLS